MSNEPVALGDPPSYDASDSTWPPTILILSKQSIYAEAATSAPLYQLNRGVTGLTHATTEVEVERVERAVKTSTSETNDHEPAVKSRARHIYTLKHMRRAPGGLESLPSDSPHYYIEAVSKRFAVGDIGLKKERFRSSRWVAVPIDVSGGGASSSYGLPKFVKDAQPLFKIRRDEDGKYRWSDGEGNSVAVEDEGDGQHRLLIGVSLCRQKVDALVALWCCRLWMVSAENSPAVDGGMDRVRRKLKLAKEVPTLGNTFF